LKIPATSNSMNSCMRYYSFIRFSCRILLCMSLISGMTRSYAQTEECLNRLNQAEELFQLGIFEDVSVLLEECLGSYEPADKKRAYKLIVIARYMNDEVTAAEETMHAMLKEFPSFKPDNNDPVDFQLVYNTFQVKKLFDLGIVLGPEMAWGIISEFWSPFDDRYKYLPAGPGYNAGAQINYYITSYLTINSQPAISSYSYGIRYNSPINSVLQLNHKEHHFSFEIPLYAQMEFFKTRIKPYIKLGGMAGVLLSSTTKSNVERYDPMNNEIIFTSEENEKNNKQFRNDMNYFVGGGIGMNLELNNYRLFAELDYHQTVNKIMKRGSNRFEQNSLWTEGWFDPDFRLQKLSFRIGIMKSIYLVRKQK
jgi:hypothetical protein